MPSISITESDYPELLKHIAKPPLLLYYKGNLDVLKQTCIAVVGTRKNSEYGKQCTEKLIIEFADSKTTIVSGLAKGIDGIAHREALKQGLKTVAVLGHGFNYMHPANHRALAESIIRSGGCLLTEFSPETPPYKVNFLKRNRIISGVSRAVCVVECPPKSGAMNTANHAFEQNRDVYTFPGDISRSQSIGTLQLIQRSQASAIASAKYIFKDLNLSIPFKQIKPIDHNKEEAEIYKLISSKAQNLETISQKTTQDAAEIARILTILELKGDIQKTNNGYVLVL